MHRLVNRPVQRLLESTQRVAQGDLDCAIPVTSADEIGQLTRSFVQMTEKLKIGAKPTPRLGPEARGGSRDQDERSAASSSADHPVGETLLGRPAGSRRRARTEQPADRDPHIRPHPRQADARRIGRTAAAADDRQAGRTVCHDHSPVAGPGPGTRPEKRLHDLPGIAGTVDCVGRAPAAVCGDQDPAGTTTRRCSRSWSMPAKCSRCL